MANVLTDLAADIYKAADTVAREQVGFIPSVRVNGDAVTRVAKGDTVRAAFTRTPTLNTTFAPSMTIPQGTDQTVDNKTMTVDSFYSVQIPYTGEDIRHLRNGAGYETVYGDQLAQAMRVICNQIEADLWAAAYKASSRGHGTAGTTPFASNFNELPQVRKILEDNGCPFDGQLSVVMNTAAGANLRSLAQLQKANEAGGDALLRQGTLLDLQGFMLKQSAQISVHTKGTGASYLLSAAGAVGDTTINVDTGSNTILAGDIITIAGTTDKYVVNTALSGGVFTIGSPGLRAAEADNDAVTVGNSYTPNIALHRDAVELAIRAPALPDGGDAAVDMMTVQDPRSGLVFDLAVYKGYMKTMIEVRALVGVKAWKSDFIATLLG